MKRILHQFLVGLALAFLLCGQALAADSTILASGTTAATSSDVTVTSTGNVTASGFTVGMPGYLDVFKVVNGVEVKLGRLDADTPSYLLASPGTYRVKRYLMANAVEVVASVGAGGSASVAQGSTTAGQNGDLTQGAVTTAAPTYTTAQTDPLSLTTGGALRTDITTIAGAAWPIGSGTQTTAPRVTIASSQVAQANWGHGATGSAVPVNASYGGCNGLTSNPANATGGNLTGVSCNHAGALVVVPAIRENLACQYTQTTGTGETTVVSAGAAGVFNDIYSIDIDTGGVAAATITLRATTGGSTYRIINYPAGAAAQPSIHHLYWPPLAQPAAAANWTVQNSVSTATNFTICYVKNL